MRGLQKAQQIPDESWAIQDTYQTYASVIGTSLPAMSQAFGPAMILESGLEQQLNGTSEELKDSMDGHKG